MMDVESGARWRGAAGGCCGRGLVRGVGTGLALLGILGCNRSRNPGTPAVAADGRQHYAQYSPKGEVTNASGAVDIYAATGANALPPAAAMARRLVEVYMPNSRSASVSVIDPATYRVVRTFPTGAVPQHVVPAYDLTRLWVLNNSASTLTPHSDSDVARVHN